MHFASSTKRPRHQRAAFTLLEILIAMVLMSLLLVVVWSLFGTFSRLEDRSAKAAVELQLVRSISQHFRTDVEHFATLALPARMRPPDSTEVSTEETGETESGDTASTEANLEADADDNSEAGEEPSPSEEDTFDERFADESPQQETALGQPFDSNVNQFDVPELTRNDFRQQQQLNSSLLEKTYLRGNATRLEIVTRMPYTVDVPTGNQILGAETRYGTHQLVVYEWRDVRNLETLLRDDPVLNPSKFRPPPPAPVLNPRLPPAAPPVATMLNPNENVGLIREVKSWLHFSRDRRNDAVRKQAEAAGVLVDGKLPWELNPNLSPPMGQTNPLSNQTQTTGASSATGGNSMDLLASMWTPPPEFRHRRDHMPEVTKLQFRYFDGDRWRLDWNNNDLLPLAIEVAFDLDPDAPQSRAKEFEAAHAAMLGGANVTELLPPKEEPEDDLFGGLDALSKLNLDPTAIITEYRFVVRIPAALEQRKDGARANRQDSPSAAAPTEAEASFERGASS